MEKLTENEEINQEIREMIALGIIDEDSIECSGQVEVGTRNNPSASHTRAGLSETEERNQEVKNMIRLGLLDKDWAERSGQVEAGTRNNPSANYTRAGLSENEEMSQEVESMIRLGLMDKDWAEGLNKTEAEMKFTQVLFSDPSPRKPKAEVETNLVRSSLPSGSRTQNSQSMRGDRVLKKNYKLITLSHDDEIFKDISADFERCGIERKIQAIQRVENEKLKTLFENETSQLERLHENDSMFDVNLKDLYHASNAARNLLCNRGLDHRLGRIGLFGKGIYFSDNVKKCEKYLSNTKGCAIYRCSVILGDIMEYPDKVTNTELKQEPEKESGDYYHSVKGNVDGFNEYIVYDNRRCLIKYRIVLEGIEDEDIDDEQVLALEERDQKEEEIFETWKRRMHNLVDSCKHEDEGDANTELETRNIEKIRLEIRRRREVQGEQPLTEVTYDLLRKERKRWKTVVNKGTENSKMPPQQKSDNEKLNTKQPTIPVPDVSVDTEDDPVQLVLDTTMTQFLEFTGCEDMALAKSIIENQQWDLPRAVNEYFSIMQ